MYVEKQMSFVLIIFAHFCSSLYIGGKVSPYRRRLSHGRGGMIRMDVNAVNTVSFENLDGTNVRIGIISTRWNAKIIDSLKSEVKNVLLSNNVKEENIFETSVPGSWELPSAARFLALSGTVDAILCLGCLIKGDTLHFEYIADSVSSGLMSVQLQTSVPCTFGILTVLNEEQAIQRSSGPNNHGTSWAKTTIEMASLRQSALGISNKAGTINLGFANSDDPDSSSPKMPKIGDKKIYF
mmetsp:Transcript_72/g.128  ORF Transcript_72/g.128 Transcript_72/m.128 type:complete len:239 (+) Transcript_72:26-742(+)